MNLTGPQFKQIQEALLNAFDKASLRRMVLFGLDEDLPQIADGENLTEIVFNLVKWAVQQNRIAELIVAAVAENPSNDLLSRLISAWPELASAPRHLELAYLDEVVRQYNYWAEKYTPLAGIAEVQDATRGGPNLDLPRQFIPSEFVKLEEHGSSTQSEIKRVPVEDLRGAVTKYKRLVLLGDPGAGKSTTLWRLAYDLAEAARHDDQAPLPLLVPLGGYTGNEGVQDYAQKYFGDLGPHLAAYLHQGRIVLLLDGLNEMPPHGYRERVDRIQTLLERFNRAPALVTCRARDYVAALVPTAEAALERLGNLLVDLVLIDVALPGMNGIDLVATLHQQYPELSCLILSGHDEIDYVRRALAAGAKGYVVKGDPLALLAVITCVLAGEIYLSDELRRK